MDLQALVARYREAGAYVEREDEKGLLLASGGVDLEDGSRLDKQPPRGALGVSLTDRLAELRKLAAALDVPASTLEAEDFAARLITFTASDESVDRYGSRILTDGSWEGKKYGKGKGWQLKAFARNPVFMPFHSYSTIPLGLAVDTWKDEAKGRKRLRQTVLMDDGSANPAAPLVLAAYKSRLMRAVSVGFWPVAIYEPTDDEERKELGLGRWGVLYTEQELWEVSAVAIPANPNALVEGIDFERVDEVVALADQMEGVYPELAYQIRGASSAHCRSSVELPGAPPLTSTDLPLDGGANAANMSATSTLELRAALDCFGGLCSRLENLIVELEGSTVSARVAPAAAPPPAERVASRQAPYGELLDILEETRSALRDAKAPSPSAQE